MEWRILIVDDQAAGDIEEFIKGNKTVEHPDSVSCVQCEKFPDAVELLKNQRFDLVILDVKDDADPDTENLAGKKVFEEIKKHRFLPVIFHTGYSHKVEDLISAYVKVVTRADWEVLRSTVKSVLATKLPRLIRHIEEEQRKFMWDTAHKIWADDLDKSNPTDLVYLLARRLANSLSGNMVRTFLEADATGGAPKSDKIHAVELYVYPPVSPSILFGDIFGKTEADDSVSYFVAITPSCDHVQGKANFIFLARCVHLIETSPGITAKKSLEDNADISSTTTDKLKRFIQDNSSPIDRYKFLPGTSFLPDLVVDLQDTRTIPPEKLGNYRRIASLDSPFAEALQVKMTRYFGRIGTPDLDPDLALERFKELVKSAVS